jgi:E3 ubiquitin-protein ligase UHRF1
MACSTSSLHAPTVAGISGDSLHGAYSLCLSGGYEDDLDEGSTVTFTGCGGRDLRGTPAKRKNLRTAPQSMHQSFQNPLNAALKRSVETQRPVRVLRGFKGRRPYAPPEGYLYCGLYVVERCWVQRGQSGFDVCRFALRRLEGQGELPTFRSAEEEE